MARKYPLSDVGSDSDALNVNIDVVGEIPRHPEPSSVDAREVSRNPRGDEIEPNGSSSDVGSDISSSVGQIHIDERMNQEETANSISSGISDLPQWLRRVTSVSYFGT